MPLSRRNDLGDSKFSGVEASFKQDILPSIQVTLRIGTFYSYYGFDGPYTCSLLHFADLTLLLLL